VELIHFRLDCLHFEGNTQPHSAQLHSYAGDHSHVKRLILL